MAVQKRAAMARCGQVGKYAAHWPALAAPRRMAEESLCWLSSTSRSGFLRCSRHRECQQKRSLGAVRVVASTHHLRPLCTDDHAGVSDGLEAYTGLTR